MSKPISFGFGKQKPNTAARPITNGTKPATALGLQKKLSTARSNALNNADEDEHDEEEPKAEALTGFSTSGAILSAPVEEKKQLVIENTGNNWRKFAGRQKSDLPSEVRAVQAGKQIITVEKDDVSKASGLQLANSTATDPTIAAQSVLITTDFAKREPVSEDDAALRALLAEDEGKPTGTAVIEAEQDERHNNLNDRDNFQAFVESHPDSSTLDEYAAMPVEEFGMAMLRGMGKKRRANGEVVQLESDTKKEEKRVKRQEFLGIGAKAATGLDGVELGAWGKADMRKNNKGAGFFTPLMVRDAKTGEAITEDELERRKKTAKDGQRGNSSRSSPVAHDEQRNGRDVLNGTSRQERNRDSDYDSSRSRRRRDEDENYDGSRSRRMNGRSRSRERYKRSKEEDRYDRHRGRYRDSDSDRHRDRHKDRDRYSDHRSEGHKSNRR